MSRRIIQVIEFRGQQSYLPDEIKVLCEDGTIWHGISKAKAPDDNRGVWKWTKVNLPPFP